MAYEGVEGSLAASYAMGIGVRLGLVVMARHTTAGTGVAWHGVR